MDDVLNQIVIAASVVALSRSLIAASQDALADIRSTILFSNAFLNTSNPTRAEMRRNLIEQHDMIIQRIESDQLPSGISNHILIQRTPAGFFRATGHSRKEDISRFLRLPIFDDLNQAISACKEFSQKHEIGVVFLYDSALITGLHDFRRISDAIGSHADLIASLGDDSPQS